MKQSIDQLNNIINDVKSKVHDKRDRIRLFLQNSSLLDVPFHLNFMLNCDLCIDFDIQPILQLMKEAVNIVDGSVLKLQTPIVKPNKDETPKPKVTLQWQNDIPDVLKNDCVYQVELYNEEKENEENKNEIKSQWKLVCEMKNENKKNEMELKYEWDWMELYSLRMRACFNQHSFCTPYTNTLTFQTGKGPSILKSVILTPSEEEKLIPYLPNKKYKQLKFILLYRGSRDGFTTKKFHEKCDYQGPTICIVLSNYNHVFGGFTNIPWTSNDAWKMDAEAFLYLLRSSNASRPSEKWMVKPDEVEYAIRHKSGYGPAFGNDMRIVDNCNSSTSNCSDLGYCYNTSRDKNKLAGAYNFTVKEYEVYKVE